MRLVFAMCVAVFVSGCQRAPPSDTAKRQISAVTSEWTAGMTVQDMDRVVALYDPEAVLWGTRSLIFI